MAAREKRPAVLRKPWPPTDFKKIDSVIVPWDDWVTEQNVNKRGEVWDIIYYNFQTYNPDEVNWYMREWLGCRMLAADGMNYRFGRESGNLTAIQLYVPKDDYFPPGRKQKEAERATLQVLSEPGVAGMHFKAGVFELKAGDLTAVANGIRAGKIHVIHRPSLGHMAQYWPSTNNFLIPFDTAPGANDKALIVHEAVHAAMDIRKVPLAMEASEGGAYIAQATYLLQNGIDMGASVPQPAFNVNPRNFVAWTGIFKAAASAAQDIANGQSPSLASLITLGLSLNLAPTYTNQGNPNNDGI